VRQVWSQLLRLPQALLVQSDQLPFDSAYALALVPPVALSLLFFRADAVVLYGLCLLAGIVCLLSLQLVRMTVGVPAWVGFKATHPLISSLLVPCFLSPLAPPWVGVGLVLLLVALDTVVWPRLMRMLTHPALLILGAVFLIQRQLHISFVNPFDMRPLDDPLMLWYRLHIVVDPVKMYVGNVPGPLGATSMGAVLLGVAYLWYTRKISLSLLLGYYVGLAAASVAYNFDVAFQLSSGPALFVAGFLAADRRRMLLSDRITAGMGLVAGGLTIVLRALGQGPDAAWQSLLTVTLITTVAYQVTSGVRLPFPSVRRPKRVQGFRTLSTTERKGVRPVPSTPARTPLATPARQPVLATSSATVARRQQPARVHQFDVSAQDDIVRQMRIQAARRAPSSDVNRVVQALTLLVFNPVGLWLTWRNRYDPGWLKWALSVVSVLWYVGIGAAAAILTLRGFRL
jgi:NQR2, RnfD, RnfE family